MKTMWHLLDWVSRQGEKEKKSSSQNIIIFTLAHSLGTKSLLTHLQDKDSMRYHWCGQKPVNLCEEEAAKGNLPVNAKLFWEDTKHSFTKYINSQVTLNTNTPRIRRGMKIFKIPLAKIRIENQRCIVKRPFNWYWIFCPSLKKLPCNS